MSWWDDYATREGVFGVAPSEYDELTLRQARYIWSRLSVEDDPVIRLVDVGCGIGRIMQAVRQQHSHVSLVGVDTSHSMLAAAFDNVAPPVALTTQTGGRFARRADGAWCVLVMQHLDDNDAAELMARIAQHLQCPGARLVSQWLIGDPDNSTQRSYPRTQQTVTSLITAAGLEVVSVDSDDDVTSYSAEWIWVTAERPLP